MTLRITSFTVIMSKLTLEAILRPKSRSKIEVQSFVSYTTQTVDGHAIGIGTPLGNSWEYQFLSVGLYGTRMGEKKHSRGGHRAKKITQANMRLDP